MATINTFNIGGVDLPGDGYPPLSLFGIPYAGRLSGAFFFGADAKVAANNWGGDTEVEFVGSPSISGGFASVDGLNFIDTGVPETLAATMFVVFRETGTAATAIMGNYGSTSQIGISLYVPAGSTTLNLNTGRVGGTGGVVTIGSNTAAWGIYSARVPATGQATLKNHMSGASSTAGASADRELNGVGSFRIGSFYSASFAGPSQVFAALYYSSALTAEEADVVAEHLRQMAAAAGITV